MLNSKKNWYPNIAWGIELENWKNQQLNFPIESPTLLDLVH